MKIPKSILFLAVFSTAFLFWTVTVSFIDVQAIGPLGTSVGLSTVNSYIHKFFGVNLSLYYLTDILSIIPIGVAVGFAALGFLQLIIRKKFSLVDRNIIILGVFYTAVFSVFFFFEKVIINYRPILINGVLEASYPSSTTVLTLCVMISALTETERLIKKKSIESIVFISSIVFTFFMVLCRLLSGVHWFSDIIGGILISSALLFLYRFFIDLYSGK